MRHEELLQSLYEPCVQAARRRFEVDGGVRLLLDPTLEPALFERFLLQYACLEAQRARLAPAWLRRAGERCLELGWDSPGQELRAHGSHTAGAEQGWREELGRLVHGWNVRHLPRLDAETLLCQQPVASFTGYVRLHEEALAGPLPAGLVALALELEGLGAAWSRPLLAQARRLLGPGAAERLRFLSAYVEREPERVALHRRRLGEVLALLPQAAPALAELGAQALELYARMLHECLHAAAAQLRPEGARSLAVA